MKILRNALGWIYDQPRRRTPIDAFAMDNRIHVGVLALAVVTGIPSVT